MMNLSELSEPIASGRTADIYPWGDGSVLKMYREGISLQYVKSERRKASIAFSMGISTPFVGEIVHLGVRRGLIFERIEGQSMMEKLLLEPDSIKSLANLLAELHRSLHGCQPLDGLPTQGDLLCEKVLRCTLLSETERFVLHETIAHLRSDERLCHGDFHPGNVMLTKKGPMIVDWVDASRGNPIADVARTSLLFLGHIEASGIDDAQKTAMALYHQTYLDHYMESEPGRWSEYEQWLPVMAAVRLSEGITEQQDWLLQQARKVSDAGSRQGE